MRILKFTSSIFLVIFFSCNSGNKKDEIFYKYIAEQIDFNKVLLDSTNKRVEIRYESNPAFYGPYWSLREHTFQRLDEAMDNYNIEIIDEISDIKSMILENLYKNDKLDSIIISNSFSDNMSNLIFNKSSNDRFKFHWIEFTILQLKIDLNNYILNSVRPGEYLFNYIKPVIIEEIDKKNNKYLSKVFMAAFDTTYCAVLYFGDFDTIKSGNDFELRVKGDYDSVICNSSWKWHFERDLDKLKEPDYKGFIKQKFSDGKTIYLPFHEDYKIR